MHQPANWPKLRVLPELERVQNHPLRSIDDVRKSFIQLSKELQRTELTQLRNFHRAYLIITTNVIAAVNSGRFNDSAFLEKFDVIFAGYYYRALREFVSGREVPGAWRAAFAACSDSEAESVILMSLGINAHINNDIPFALRDSGAGRQHRADYDLINTIILNSIYEVLDSLEPSRSMIGARKRRVRPIYKLAMYFLAQRWRRKAWDHYKMLDVGSVSAAKIESRATLKARWIQKIPL